MSIKSMNQHTTLEGVHVIRYVMDSGNEMLMPYPDYIGQGMTKKEQCARKMFFHNTAMMDHRDSSLNEAELSRLKKQMEGSE